VRTQLRQSVADLCKSRASLQRREDELASVRAQWKDTISELDRLRLAVTNQEEEFGHRDSELAQLQAHYVDQLEKVYEENAELRRNLQERSEELARHRSQEHAENTSDSLAQARQQLWNKEQELLEWKVQFDFTAAELGQSRSELQKREEEVEDSTIELQSLLRRRDLEISELRQHLESTNGNSCGDYEKVDFSITQGDLSLSCDSLERHSDGLERCTAEVTELRAQLKQTMDRLLELERQTAQCKACSTRLNITKLGTLSELSAYGDARLCAPEWDAQLESGSHAESQGLVGGPILDQMATTDALAVDKASSIA